MCLFSSIKIGRFHCPSQLNQGQSAPESGKVLIQVKNFGFGTADIEERHLTEKKLSMVVLYRILAVVTSLALAAHFYRWNQPWFVLACLSIPFSLIPKKRWVPTTGAAGLLFGSAVWLNTGIELVSQRMTMGQEWLRPAIIMGTVALITLYAAWGVYRLSGMERYR
jgi:hypothetical protein